MMQLKILYTSALFLLFIISPSLGAKKNPKDAILLSNVKSLTLRDGVKTSHRRVSAIPQLTCKGPGCKHYKVDIMRCVNQGSGYNTEDIEWSCSATIPEEFKLGSTDVICEGYDGPNDEKVLKGSCGVEYRLLLTDKGNEKYGGGWFSSPKGNAVKEDTDWGGYLFGLLFFGVLLWILYSMWAGYQRGPAARRAPRQGGFWGGGGGGGGGGNDPYDPPPPYDPYPGKSYSRNTQAEGWRPGFWSGALGGAAAGYMAGNRGGRQEIRETPRNNGWFGGGNGGSGWGAPTRGSSSSSSSSGSGARHESTGFGSTSRR